MSLKCEFCGSEHDGTYGSGRFCSATCSRKYSNTFVSDEGRANQIKALQDKENQKKSKESRIKNFSIKKEEMKKKKDEIKQHSKNIKKMDIGKIGELETIKKFLQNNVPVYIPVVDNNKVDMIANIDGNLSKIQVKSTYRVTGAECNITPFNLVSQKRIFDTETKTYKNAKTFYDTNEVDYFALYDGVSNNVYLVENDGRETININKSEPGTVSNSPIVNYAQDYLIDNVIENIRNGITNIIDIE